MRAVLPLAAAVCLGAAVMAAAAEPTAGADPARLSIAVDAAQRAEPISPYIYGQFIEHLGRCIYGGIWAEMLEDRKFYYPVAAKESPWTAAGGDVVMVDQAPFVGEHTPEIRLKDSKGGIVQAGLGLEKGRQYVGRIWLAGAGEAAPVEVSLVWGDGPAERQTIKIAAITAEYQKTPLEFTAGADTDDGRLEIVALGRGSFRVGTASLMPADNVHGMRADTLALLKELDSPIYRWPGGNFVSGYDWRDGIGDVDRRPPRKNPAWKGVEHNDFGIDDFFVFCREINTEPLIVVNSGLGGLEMAIAELAYVNGGADTEMGRLRAKNGHAEPYGVVWWGIGNEMYGNWQLGHMPLEKYVEKHIQFAEAMREVDPKIKLIAVGDAGRWSETMLRLAADHMDLISEHFYVQEKPDLVAHVAQMTEKVRGKAEAHRRYRRELESLAGKDIRISQDEWNYWYGPHLYGELGTRYFLKDALGVAAGLHEYARNSDLFYMANYAQTVNVIGAIKTTKTAAAFDTTGLALKLYRRHFGTVPVKTEATAPLDAQAAWSADGKTLTLGIVNPTLKPAAVALAVHGAKLTGKGRLWKIAGDDPMAYNEPGKPPAVSIEESPLEGVTDALEIAPCSISVYSLTCE
jgi:alpha-N-arabinofuranosidase